VEDNEQIEPVDEANVLIPVEQHTLIFYGKPIVVVRLPDGQPAVVMRYLCDNMQLDRSSQIKRIQRTKAIARDLVTALVETTSGAQKMPALILRSVTYWLLGIDPGRARSEMQDEILRYQQEAVDALYTWAQAPRAISAPTNLVPAEPITKPTTPADDAPLDVWREYYQRMLALVDWQMDMETWRGKVESRLEGVEAMTGLIPEILGRLGPETLTPVHQNLVKYYVQQLSKATGKHTGTIYSSLYTAFSVPRYQEIPEAEWDKVERWFKVQIERTKRK